MNKLIRFFRLLAFWKKRDKWDDPEVDTYDEVNIPERILNLVKDLKIPVVQIEPYIKKYPYTFLKFGEKYPDPEKWDSIFHVNKHMDFTAPLKMFFAESKLILTTKKTMQYDPRFNAIRVASFKMMVSRRDEDGHAQVICKAQGNPLKVMPEVLEYLLHMKDEILQAEESGRKPNIQMANIAYPMAEKECESCQGLLRNNPKNLGVCPECYTPVNDIMEYAHE